MRVVLRVLHVSNTMKIVRVLIPSWSVDQGILLNSNEIPKKFHDHLFPGSRFYVEVNLDAEFVSEISIQNFQLIPDTIEYRALLGARRAILDSLPYLSADYNIEAYRMGIYSESLESLQEICRALGEPMPEI